MNLQIESKSKILGQYYTPAYIVDYIIDQTIGNLMKSNCIEYLNSLTILDPACGLGIFLVRALNFILTQFKIKDEINDDLDRVRRSIIANQLYGVDVDQEVIIKTQSQLQCPTLNINTKVFDAILSPPGYKCGCDVTRLIELRKQYKGFFIEGDKKSLEKEIKNKIDMIEVQILEIIKNQLENEFKLSLDSRIMPWEIAFPETKGRFDIIIGNPPWGTFFSSNFLKFYKVGIQQVDTWSLFLEKSLQSLKEGGRLGFVIPNTLLINENYTSARKFILETCHIIKIINLGEKVFPKVTQPCMVIILEKGSSHSNHKVEIIRYISKKSIKLLKKGKINLSSLDSVSCYQNRFLNNPDFIYDIFSIGFEDLKKTIEKDLPNEKIQVKPLKDLVENARGVEINKNGKIIRCSFCGWWSSPPSNMNKKGIQTKPCNNPKCQNEVTEHDITDFIVYEVPQQPERDRPFLVGHQIERYNIHNHLYIDPTRKGINYKTPSLYKGPKLLLRKTGRGIKTAIDYDDRWVNQVIYLFKLKENAGVSLEYLLGILNSRLIYNYYYKEFADPNRHDFPHFTQKRFLQLPIKIPVTKNEIFLAEKIGDKAKLLQSTFHKKYSEKHQYQKKKDNNTHLDQKIKQLEEELDNLVFALYQLTSDQKKLILSSLSA